MRGPTLYKAVVAAGAVALLAAACSSSSSGGGGSSAAASTGGGSTPASSTGSSTQNFGGKTINIWTSMDKPVYEGLAAELAPKAKALGINVKWTQVSNINQILPTKAAAGALPDIATVPQPGVLQSLLKYATPLNNILDVNALQQSMIPGVLDTATFNGKLYGVLISANVKGLVFYPKAAFTAKGYTVPTTLAELETLTNKIKSDGHTPWCAGIGSGAATGWPMTDWIEELVLKQDGIQTYNDWITHKVKFNSPQITNAANEVSKLLFTQGNVNGGQKAIASTNFQTADNPMFNQSPGCYLFMQGSFITAFFPTKDQQNNPLKYVGVFGFPPVTAGGNNPIEGGGDTASIYKDSPAAEAVMKLLAETDLGTVAAGNGSSFLSPHKDFPLSAYKSAFTQVVAKIAYAANGFGFDASDSMPGAVGAGTFWKQMTSWTAGQTSLTSALKAIDASWPASS